MRSTIISITIVSSALLLQGCVLDVPFEYLCHACESYKDVSSDPNRAKIVDQEYELVCDVNLYGDSKDGFYLDTERLYELIGNGQMVPALTPISIISTGNRLKVTRVLVKTCAGGELCIQKILAEFVDADCFNGFVDISSLFDTHFYFPNENWNFKPNPNLMKEVTPDSQ